MTRDNLQIFRFDSGCRKRLSFPFIFFTNVFRKVKTTQYFSPNRDTKIDDFFSISLFMCLDENETLWYKLELNSGIFLRDNTGIKMMHF